MKAEGHGWTDKSVIVWPFSSLFSQRSPQQDRLVGNGHRIGLFQGYYTKCAHSGTHLALEQVQQAQEAGADGAMITPPYYTYSGFEGLYRHYEIINSESDLGIMIYFSSAVLHQVQDVISDPALLYKICELPHISGFKDATKNYFFARDISIALNGKVAVVESGGPGRYMWVWDFSAPGFITGLGNI